MQYFFKIKINGKIHGAQNIEMFYCFFLLSQTPIWFGMTLIATTPMKIK